MKQQKCIIYSIFLSIILIVVLGGCQDLFTTGLFNALQTNPENMSADQLVTYGNDVLTTGDEEKMEEVYEVVEDTLEEDPDDPELNYLAANLAAELSGFNDLLDIGNLSSYADDNDALNEIIDIIDTDILAEAAEYYQEADNNGYELNAQDNICCGIGLLLDSIGGDLDNLDTVDIDNPTPEQEEAIEFIEAGIELLSSEEFGGLIESFFASS